MALLHEIQSALVDDKPLGPILLKLRFLASKLGSEVLGEWVKYETEGYPNDVEVPEYRKIGVSYLADFSGPFGSGIKNAPIPPYLIHEHCGPDWNEMAMRQSIAGIDKLIGSDKEKDKTLIINSANLILLLQGKVYNGYACNSVRGILSIASLSEIQYAVRTRIMELTLKIEKDIPDSAMIDIGKAQGPDTHVSSDQVTRITNQIIHGNYTNISSSGANASIQLNVQSGDASSVAEALTKAGISKSDAEDFAKIISSENPDGPEQPFGTKAKEWMSKNLSKALDGSWTAGISTATKVLTEAALKFYGLT